MFSLTKYKRRVTTEVHVGPVIIGGVHSVAVQSMTNTDTNNTDASVAQIVAIRDAGGQIIRLTAPSSKEGENLRNIAQGVRERGLADVALVADIHFTPDVAMIAAEYVDKVRINPGNYRDADGCLFLELLEKCRKRGVALRIGVNHGSLASDMVDRFGDTPQGMVESAMAFLRICKTENFDQVVVSMKSSNVRVMVHAYRMLVVAMDAEDMHYPLHLGVTEAGNGEEGRVKSAVGIGTLLADGIGDTIRVSLTEAPQNEIPVAQAIVQHFADRANHEPVEEVAAANFYHPTEYMRRATNAVGRVGGANVPVIFSELTEDERNSENIEILESTNKNPVAHWRARILNMSAQGDKRPVILHRKYNETSLESLWIKAAADFGALFIDGLADGIYIENTGCGTQQEIDSLSLNILQASRTRMSRTEYIACPGCGRTQYDLENTLTQIQERTSHLKGLKIGVMGCIVNGPGEMADADYGYVGAGNGRITLYKGKEVVKHRIAQDEAIDQLIDLIKQNNDWVSPDL